MPRIQWFNYLNLMTIQQLVTEENVNDVQDNITPLMLAIKKNKFEFVKILVEHGAHIHYINNEHNALMYACLFKRTEICSYLILKGADVNIESQSGWSALLIAVNKNELNIVRLLIANDAHINHQNKFGTTPLMVASQRNHTSLIRELLQLGANPDLVNNEGNTAGTLSDYPSMQQLILSYTALPLDSSPIATHTTDRINIANTSQEPVPNDQSINEAIIHDLKLENLKLKQQLQAISTNLSILENKQLMTQQMKLNEPLQLDTLEDDLSEHLLKMKQTYEFFLDKRNDLMKQQDVMDEVIKCNICMDKVKSYAANCGHLFCQDCISLTTCPNDRIPIISKLKIYL